MAIKIKAVGSYLPEKVLSNDELALRLDTSDEWIVSHTGIRERRIAAPDESTSDLGYLAALAAVAKAGIELSEIGLIVVSTATPDYIGFPSTACMVHKLLGLKNTPAFDIAAGCTGFVYALEVAKGMMISNPSIKYSLVIGAEMLTRIVDWEDRATCVLFGDGAGAVVLEHTEGESRMLASFLGADGEGWSKLIFRRGGIKEPILAGETFVKAPSIFIDGRAVYTFAVQAICDLMNNLSEATGIALNDLAHIVPHQANTRIIQAAAKRLGVPESRFFINIDKFANTSSASIPIALADMDSRGMLRQGDTVMLLAFGAGLTYGGSVLKW